MLIRDPVKHYYYLGGKLRTEPIEGDKIFNTLEEWYSYPYKYDIMNQVLDFNKSMHQEANAWWFRVERRTMIGLYPEPTNTPIYYSEINFINEFIKRFGQGVRDEPHNGIIPKSLIQTRLGYTIYQELTDAIPTFTNNVFCHGCLRYDSFIVRDNKLVGIRNWEYAGYYPPEFDTIIQRYLEYT